MLTRSTKLAYATGGVGMNLANLVISQWIYKRYVPSPELALIPVGLFGAIFFFGRITDAITDPLVAFWSDRRPAGRRRLPFVRWGTPLLALVFFLLWVPPAGPSWLVTAWAIVLIQAWFILYTVVVTPYLALLPEIATGDRERVDLSTLQAVFVLVGTGIFAIVGVIIQGWGWAALGLVVALLTGLSFLPTAVHLRERPTQASSEGLGLAEWLRLTFRNRPFRYLILSTSFYWFGLNLLIMLVPYQVSDVLGLTEAQVPLLMGPFLGANLVFFFVFGAIAKRWGKHLAFLLTLGGSALLTPLLSAVGHLPGSELLQSALIMGIIGIPAAGFMMLPFAILADVVDHDERLTGRRREAIYFGVQAILQKSMIGLSIFTFGLVTLSGTTTSLAGLRAVPIIAAVAFAAAFFSFIGYPLREKV